MSPDEMLLNKARNLGNHNDATSKSTEDKVKDSRKWIG